MHWPIPLKTWRVPRWPADGREYWPVILMYHSVLKTRTDPWGLRVWPRIFFEQMAALRANANPMKLADLDSAMETGRLPLRPVVVTFDDGYADNLWYAKPILERFSIPATVFVSTGYVGGNREYWWDELDLLLLKTPRLPRELELTIKGQSQRFDLGVDASLSSLARFKYRHWRAWHAEAPTARHREFLQMRELLRMMGAQEREHVLESLREAAGRPLARTTYRCVSPDQLRELASGELIEIGAHSVTHSSLGALNAEQQQQEIATSKSWLESQIGRPVTSLSYPFGSAADYNADTIQIARECGIKRACTTNGGSVTPNVNRYEYPRYGVLNWSGQEFLERLQSWFVVRDENSAAASRHGSFAHDDVNGTLLFEHKHTDITAFAVKHQVE